MAGVSTTQARIGSNHVARAAGVALLALALPAAAHAASGPITNPANGHRYYLLAPDSWTAAESQAVGLGGHLATINDSAENTWVWDQFSAKFAGDPFWIGLTDEASEGNFVWTSGQGQYVTYANWAQGEPNNAGGNEDYAQIENYVLNDNPDSAGWRGIVELPPRLAAGAVVGWGDDWSRQVTPPASVNGASGTALAIAAGEIHSCARRSPTGAVVCWGDDFYGQATPPASVNGTTGAASAIAVGGYHSCAVQASTNAVVCWGSSGGYGQATPPASVNGTAGIASAITAGVFHSCAIQAGTDAVVCWGRNDIGQALPPDLVNGAMGTASAISAGSHHTCAIRAGTNAVVCWGENSDGQAPAVLGIAVSAISAGLDHTCAIQAGTNAVFCWGNNDSGQALAPASVNGTTGTASAIGAGDGYTCAIQAGTGTVVCWGANTYGQAAPPASVDGTRGKASALSAGSYSSLAIWQPLPGSTCSNGADDDGDGDADYPADLGCASPAGKLEDPQCSDGHDNDWDGLADYASDPHCSGPADNDERTPVPPSPGCGVGPELALLLPVLGLLRRRRSSSS